MVTVRLSCRTMFPHMKKMLHHNLPVVNFCVIHYGFGIRTWDAYKTPCGNDVCYRAHEFPYMDSVHMIWGWAVKCRQETMRLLILRYCKLYVPLILYIVASNEREHEKGIYSKLSIHVKLYSFMLLSCRVVIKPVPITFGYGVRHSKWRGQIVRSFQGLFHIFGCIQKYHLKRHATANIRIWIHFMN